MRRPKRVTGGRLCTVCRRRHYRDALLCSTCGRDERRPDADAHSIEVARQVEPDRIPPLTAERIIEEWGRD